MHSWAEPDRQGRSGSAQLANTLTRLGAKLILTARNQQKLEEVRRNLRKLYNCMLEHKTWSERK